MLSKNEPWALLWVHIYALEAIYGLTSIEVFKAKAKEVFERELGLKVEEWRGRDEEGYVYERPTDTNVYVAASGRK